MKTLLSVMLVASSLLSINVQANEVEKSAEQLLSQQVEVLNRQLAMQINQDIKFAIYTIKMPVVADQKTLVAQTAKTVKKESNSE